MSDHNSNNIKVLTFNWQRGNKQDIGQIVDKFIEKIKDEKIDIFFFQEFTEEIKYDLMIKLFERLNDKKYLSQIYEFKYDPQLETDIVYTSDRFVVLEKPDLIAFTTKTEVDDPKSKYIFKSYVQDTKTTTNIVLNSIQLSPGNNKKSRVNQIDMVSESIQDYERALVGGDYNTTSKSDSTLTEPLKQVGLVNYTKNLKSTYNFSRSQSKLKKILSPILKLMKTPSDLDKVYGRGLRVKNCYTIDTEFSAHLACVVELQYYPR